MDKFTQEAMEVGISPSTVETMAKRDLEYKESINRKIAGIKARQIASLVLASILVVLMTIILLQVFKTLDRIDSLIKAILYATGLMQQQ